MPTTSSRRSGAYAISLVLLLGALVAPATSAAEVERFHRFEAVATANYTVTEVCPDGSTAQTRVTVIEGTRRNPSRA